MINRSAIRRSSRDARASPRRAASAHISGVLIVVTKGATTQSKFSHFSAIFLSK